MAVSVVVDVDGCVSPIDGPTQWKDDVIAGHAFGGPVHISPTVCAYLDNLAQIPGIQCIWLTSWSKEDMTGLRPWPGRDWPALPHPSPSSTSRGWWKAKALEQAVTAGHANPELDAVDAIVWMDDHLRNGARAASCRRRLGKFGLDVHLIAPATDVGLTPTQVAGAESFIVDRIAPPHRFWLEIPWRDSPVAPCGCSWDGWTCPHCGGLTTRHGPARNPGHTVTCHATGDAAPRPGTRQG